MTTFDDRETAFEAKYAHDAEMQFRAAARRNKLLGLWAASLLGKNGDAAASYAGEVVASDLAEAGDEDVYRKVAGEKLGRLSAIPPQLRGAEYVIRDKAQLGESLPNLQKQVVQQGLARLTVKPRMRLRLSHAALDAIATKNARGEWTGEIPMATLSAAIRSLAGGVDLVRRSAAAVVPIEELERKYLAPQDDLATVAAWRALASAHV